MSRKVTYVLAAAAFGVLAAFVVFAAIVWLGVMGWEKFRPVWIGSMVPAVVIAAWLVRPILGRSSAAMLVVGSLFAVASAALFGFGLVFTGGIGAELGIGEVLALAAYGGLMGVVACVLLGLVTFPLGFAGAWLLHAVDRGVASMSPRGAPSDAARHER